ncbi:MAG: helix-hairpin-helix domain-containing protein [Candidatus Paceibacterota bacterium]
MDEYDLKEIAGIGPKLEKALNSQGIYSIQDVSESTYLDFEEIGILKQSATKIIQHARSLLNESK